MFIRQYLIYFLTIITITFGQISDKRLCVDKKCSKPISKGTTLQGYLAPDHCRLSFNSNDKVIIYSYPAGSVMNLIGVEINGKRGYIPKHTIREMKQIEKPTELVDTEPECLKNHKNEEVIDGTTIYNQDIIKPTQTVNLMETSIPEIVQKNVENTITEENLSESSLESTKTNPDQIYETSKEINTEKTETVESPESNLFPEKIDNNQSTALNDDDQHKTGEILPEIGSEIPEIMEITPNQTVETVDVELNSPPSTVDPLKLDENIQKNESNPVDIQPDSLEINLDKIEPNLQSTDSINSDVNSSEITSNIEANRNVETGNLDKLNQNFLLESNETEIARNQQEIIRNTGKDPDQDEVNDVKEITTESSGSFFDFFSNSNENLALDDSILIPENTVATFDESSIPENTVVPLEEQSIPETTVTTFDEPPIPESTVTTLDEPSIPESTVAPLEEQSNSETTVATFDEPSILKATVVPLEEQSIPETTVTTFDESPFPETTVTTLDEPPISESTVAPLEEPSILESTVAPLEEPSIPEMTVATLDEPSIPEMTVAQSEEPSIPEITTFTPEIDSEETVNDGFLANIYSYFSGNTNDFPENPPEDSHEDPLTTSNFCEKSTTEIECSTNFFNTNLLTYLTTTAASIIIFLFIYMSFDKNRKIGPLIARICELERELTIISKENDNLREKDVSILENQDELNLLQNKLIEMEKLMKIMELDKRQLEKELESSTELGLELNRMLSETIDTQNGDEIFRKRFEELQKQLIEQQQTITNTNELLTIKTNECYELKMELDKNTKRSNDQQNEIDKLLENLLKIEEEKNEREQELKLEITSYRSKYDETAKKFAEIQAEIRLFEEKVADLDKNLCLTSEQNEILKNDLKQLKGVKNKEELLKELIDVSELKSELIVNRNAIISYKKQIEESLDVRKELEKRGELTLEELQRFKMKYEESDKLRTEIQTEFEVLSKYFKDREAQLQRDLNKYEKMWSEKQDEKSSTTERLKYMQEELKNYKAQNEALKQEIISQEVELKSQISMLEKKVHENWVSARHAERKLEEAKQEAAQLRNRLTLRERVTSPLEQNGNVNAAIDSPPPLLYGGTKSPPLLLPPPPFLPGPPGVPPPFMPPLPPPDGSVPRPPFMPPPPPPNMFPGDHRPPPLGRLSSPPPPRNYSPDSRPYSPMYDDRNHSPPYDSEYDGGSPPPRKGYGHGRSYRRSKGSNSSDSDNCDEPIEKIAHRPYV